MIHETWFDFELTKQVFELSEVELTEFHCVRYISQYRHIVMHYVTQGPYAIGTGKTFLKIYNVLSTLLFSFKLIFYNLLESLSALHVNWSGSHMTTRGNWYHKN